jgi:hypothetical protein
MKSPQVNAARPRGVPAVVGIDLRVARAATRNVRVPKFDQEARNFWSADWGGGGTPSHGWPAIRR